VTASMTDSDQRQAHNQGPAAAATGTMIGRESHWLAHDYLASAGAEPTMSGDLRPESNSLNLQEAAGPHHDGKLETVAEVGTMMIGADQRYERHHNY